MKIYYTQKERGCLGIQLILYIQETAAWEENKKATIIISLHTLKSAIIYIISYKLKGWSAD